MNTRKYTAQELENWGQRWLMIARIIREGDSIRCAQGLPELDDQELVTTIKKVYIDLQSARGVADWAFEKIPGFAKTKSKALERVNFILDSTVSEDQDVENTCSTFRDANQKRALSWWG